LSNIYTQLIAREIFTVTSDVGSVKVDIPDLATRDLHVVEDSDIAEVEPKLQARQE